VLKFDEKLRHPLPLSRIVLVDKFLQQLARVIGKCDERRIVEIDGLCRHVLTTRADENCQEGASQISIEFRDVSNQSISKMHRRVC